MELEGWQLGPDDWPLTCEAAARDIIEWLSPVARQELRATPQPDLIRLHFGLGMTIRDRHGLHRGNAALLESCLGPFGHPDSASMKIIERAWELVQGQK